MARRWRILDGRGARTARALEEAVREALGQGGGPPLVLSQYHYPENAAGMRRVLELYSKMQEHVTEW